MSETVLIVDDDPVQRRLLEAAVSRLGYAPVLADSGERALELLHVRAELRAVVLDLVMPGIDGLEVMRQMRRQGIEVPVIVQTVKDSVETAVGAMRAGAFDYVVKPVSQERLKTAVGNALKVGALEGAERRKRGKTKSSFSFRDIVRGSPAMERTIALAQKAAATDIPVLLEGESGVGKEIIAHAIRSASPRRGKPFVPVNCGAVPDNLVESILFGHEKGAFTGATEKHAGKFVEADTGTLFLDEIGELPLDVQVKILRAVQDGEVDPVGARRTVRVDIRLISATNRDLLQRVKDGAFREDLFYRLNVFPITVPPLRERKEDIPLLVQHFMSHFADAVSNEVSGISSRALDLLSAHDWPGNVRELENAILRAMVLCEGEILTVAEFPQIRAQLEGIEETVSAVEESMNSDDGAPSRGNLPKPSRKAGLLNGFTESGHIRTLDSVEREVIQLAVEHYRGRMSEVARRLGIGRSTLYRKLKEMGLEPPNARDDLS
ncbi:sigma-54-dependent transcriptional regulator [Chelativorans sp. YIM 93263]|uniref:sigma-54-dependent transcriptional regulator n=1 Tax=Chelativorans sp. YIM 93263 TaxID=2906648 RepID=UPI0023784075|nr:sigma-54 dependent transcriptional regulator [Chelativorans sp. YIM 93263]